MTVVSNDIRRAVRRLQILELQFIDGKLDPVAGRVALELVSKGQFGLSTVTPMKPRRSRKSVYRLWTPVEIYAEKIAARRDERGWELSDELIEQFTHDVMRHNGRLLPTSANIWLPGSLEYIVSELWSWIVDGQVGAGHNPPHLSSNIVFDAWHLRLIEGLEVPIGPTLSPTSLDLGHYRGSSLKAAIHHERLECLAGLDGLMLLALNPQAAPEIGKGIPILSFPALRFNRPDGHAAMNIPKGVLTVYWADDGRRLKAEVDWEGNPNPRVAPVVRSGVK